MFPGAGTSGQPDLAELLQQAQEMQQQLLDAQDELARAEVVGTSGGGLVSVTASGTGEILGVRISPEACDPADTDTLADLVLAAIRDAAMAASELQASTMSPLTQGLGGLGPASEPGPGAVIEGAPVEPSDAGPGTPPGRGGA